MALPAQTDYFVGFMMTSGDHGQRVCHPSLIRMSVARYSAAIDDHGGGAAAVQIHGIGTIELLQELSQVPQSMRYFNRKQQLVVVPRDTSCGASLYMAAGPPRTKLLALEVDEKLAVFHKHRSAADCMNDIAPAFRARVPG